MNIFENKEKKKTFAIGVLGSLWVYLAFLIGEPTQAVTNEVIREVIFITTISGILAWAMYTFKKTKWFISLVPAITWVVKEIAKPVFGYDGLVSVTILGEAFLVAIPVGITLYLFIEEKEIVRLP